MLWWNPARPGQFLGELAPHLRCMEGPRQSRKLSTSLDTRWHLPFLLAGSSRLSAQRAASQTALEVLVEVLLIALQKYLLFFHRLYGTSDELPLPAQMHITAHSKTWSKPWRWQSGIQPSEKCNKEYLAVNTKCVWRLGQTCTQHATLMVSATHARNMLLQEVLSAMSFMAENKLEYVRILFSLLRDLYFFLLLAQNNNTHRHNWERHERYL